MLSAVCEEGEKTMVSKLAATVRDRNTGSRGASLQFFLRLENREPIEKALKSPSNTWLRGGGRI
jgi:hypothetical protein